MNVHKWTELFENINHLIRGTSNNFSAIPFESNIELGRKDKLESRAKGTEKQL